MGKRLCMPRVESARHSRVEEAAKKGNSKKQGACGGCWRMGKEQRRTGADEDGIGWASLESLSRRAGGQGKDRLPG